MLCITIDDEIEEDDNRLLLKDTKADMIQVSQSMLFIYLWANLTLTFYLYSKSNMAHLSTLIKVPPSNQELSLLTVTKMRMMSKHPVACLR